MRTRARSIGWTTAVITVAAMLLAMLAPAAIARTGLPKPHRPAHRDAGDVWVQLQSKTLHLSGHAVRLAIHADAVRAEGHARRVPGTSTCRRTGPSRAGGHKVQQDARVAVRSSRRRRHRAGRPPGRAHRHRPARRVRHRRPPPAGREPRSPSSPSSCHSTGKVIARESSRRGAWNGQLHVRSADRRPTGAGLGRLRRRRTVTASRERDTGRPCPDDAEPRCTNQKIAIAFEDLDPETQVGVNLQQFARYRYAQVFQTIDDGVVRISHAMCGSGRLPRPDQQRRRQRDGRVRRAGAVRRRRVP